MSRSVALVAAACRRPSPQSLPFKFWAQSSEGSEAEEGNHDDHSTPEAVDLIHGDGNSSSEPSTPVSKQASPSINSPELRKLWTQVCIQVMSGLHIPLCQRWFRGSWPGGHGRVGCLLPESLHPEPSVTPWPRRHTRGVQNLVR